jgi:GNAT superfamily N-acetyltransferase
MMSSDFHIRPAALSDGPELLAMVRALHDATKTDRHFSLDESDAARIIANSIDSDEACALVAVMGHLPSLPIAAIIGAIASPPFNRAFRFAQEFVFWVCPEYRKSGVAGKLAEAFEAWAVEKKVDAVVMGFTAGCSTSAMGRICKRRGLTPMESVYIKRLGTT